jgi:hypothetical protein
VTAGGGDVGLVSVPTIVAALHDRAEVVRVFLDTGMDVLDELLARDADVRIVETQFNGTAAEWAREGGHPEIAARLEAIGQ